MANGFAKFGEDTCQGKLSVLRILNVLYSFLFLMFRWWVLSDVMVVRSVIHFKTLQFPKRWKDLLQDFSMFCKVNIMLFLSLLNMMTELLGRWVGGRWVGGSVVGWSVVGGLVVGEFNKTRSLNGEKIFCKISQT